MKDLLERESNFLNDIQVFNEYSEKTRNDFFNYWSEPNKSGTKMKWELEKTWDLKRRIKRWYDNEQKWNKNGSHGNGKTSGAYELLEEIRAHSAANGTGK